MTTTFPDRWGVPVQPASEKAVAVLDEAVEQLAALAGDPVAVAAAARAGRTSLVRALVAASL